MKIQIKDTTFVVIETFINTKTLLEIIIEQIKKGKSYVKSSL